MRGLILLTALLTLSACESFSFSRGEFQVREERLRRPEPLWRADMERKLDCMDAKKEDC